MQPGKSLRPRVWPASIATLAALSALAPATALGAATRPSDGALSPRLAELAKPAVRSAPPAAQARALSLAAEGPGSLVREGNRVLIEVRFDHGAAASVEDLRQAGAKVVNVSQRYQTVTVAAKPDELRALNGVPGVVGAKEVLTPITADSTCPSGAVVSEGVQQLHAGDATGEARQAFGVNGSGVTVGILSDSYNRATKAADGSGNPIATTASADVKSGDLPGVGNTCAGEETPVGVLDDTEAKGTDEGRAMAQIVHDVAPGAKLAFATAFTSETAFAQNIERLARPISQGGASARVIADDVYYLDEPFFQEGPVANAINKVTSNGVTYFTAAGNDNLIEEGTGNEIASWEAPAFRDAESCPTGLPVYATHCMDFKPEGGGPAEPGFWIEVEPEATLTIDLQWAQPWEGVTTDLDAYLLREGTEVATGNEYPNADESIQEPVEVVSWTNPEEEAVKVELAINRCNSICGVARAAANSKLEDRGGGDDGSPRVKFALIGENGWEVKSTEYPTSSAGDIVGPTIFGHAGARSAIAVGAVPYFDSSEAEQYSSRGPARHYFGPFEPGSAAPELSEADVIEKPDLAATDCGSTTFFSFFGRFFLSESPAWHFCGTSAAAPHAAGVAALMLQRNPSISPAELRADLASTATPVGSFGPDAVGSGLIDASAAVAAVTPPPSPSPAVASPPAPPPVSPPPPTTFLRKHPRKVVFTRRHSVKLAFRFGSNQGGVTFLCKVDRGRFHRCNAWFVRRWRLGKHVLRVKARRNSDGATDATPAVYRFRVRHLRHRLFRRRHTRHHHRG